MRLRKLLGPASVGALIWLGIAAPAFAARPTAPAPAQAAPGETPRAAAPVPFDPALGTEAGAAAVASGTGADYQPSGADLLTGPDTASSLGAIIVRTRN